MSSSNTGVRVPAAASDVESTDTGYEQDEEQLPNQQDSEATDPEVQFDGGTDWLNSSEAEPVELSRAYSAPEPLDEGPKPNLLDISTAWGQDFVERADSELESYAEEHPGPEEHGASQQERQRSRSYLRALRAKMDRTWRADWTHRLGRTLDGTVDRARPYWRHLRSSSGLRRRVLSRSPSMLLQNLNHSRKIIARKSVEAASEAAEFISSPTLLFRPAKMAFAIAFPLLIPLLITPWRILLILFVFYAVWYLVVAAIFATEVMMRPPWYRVGLGGQLPMVEIPPYWRGVCHNPKQDLQLDYVSVSFESLHPPRRTLRGWYIPAESTGMTFVSGSEQSAPETGAAKPSEASSADAPNPHATTPSGEHATTSRSRGTTSTGRTCVVCVHGAGRDRRNFLRHAGALHRHGYDVLLFDLSEHGLSDGSGRGTTFGAREKYDVLAAIAYAYNALQAERIVLLGTSAGASSCLLAAAEWIRLHRFLKLQIVGQRHESSQALSEQHSLDFPVQCIIAENPLARPDELFIFHLERLSLNYLPKDSYHLARKTLFWFASRVLLFRLAWVDREPSAVPGSHLRRLWVVISTLSRVLGGRTRCGAVDVMTDIHCPLFVLHGTGDEIVPVDHGMRIFAAANEPRQLWLAPDAAHCALFDQYPTEWENRVVDFIEKSLSEESNAKSSS